MHKTKDDVILYEIAIYCYIVIFPNYTNTGVNTSIGVVAANFCR